MPETSSRRVERPHSQRLVAPLLAIVAAAIWMATPSNGQEPALTERVEVQLVEVDVLATDRQGDPITDLRPEEFKLYDDGHLIEVTHFVPPTDAATASRRGDGPPEVIGTVGRPRRQRLAIFLDELHLTLRSKHLMFDQLSEFLKEGVAPNTDIMLAAFNGTVDVVLPFTNDRKRVATAIEERLLSGAATAVSLDVNEASVLRLLKTALIEALHSLTGAVPLFEMMDAACQSDVATVARGHSQQQYGRVAGVAAAMQQFVASLGAYPGHKYLLYVSDGPPLVPGQVVWDHAVELCDGSLLGGAGVGLDQDLEGIPPARRFPGIAQNELNDFNTLPLWEAVAAEASSQRVTINALHAVGIEAAPSADVDGAPLGARSQQSDRLSRQDTLRVLAEETGGQTILNRNEIRAEVQRVAATNALRYELAYPSSHPADGAVHALRLETTRPGVTLEYRRSYQSKTAEQSLVDTMLASLYHDFESNPLDLRVQAKWVEAAVVGKGLGRVRLEVSVPFGSLALLPEAEGQRGLFTVFVAAIDDRGVGTDVRKKTIPLVVAGGKGKRYDYVVEIELRKEREHKVAVAVQDEIGATSSHVVRTLRAERR